MLQKTKRTKSRWVICDKKLTDGLWWTSWRKGTSYKVPSRNLSKVVYNLYRQQISFTITNSAR